MGVDGPAVEGTLRKIPPVQERGLLSATKPTRRARLPSPGPRAPVQGCNMPRMGEGRTVRGRYTVREAAELLGISQHAIRQRIRRGTITSAKDVNGRVYVYLDQDSGVSGGQPDEASGGPSVVDPMRMLREHNQELREQLEAERNAHAETQRIAYTLAQRIPELEAPSEPRESPETDSLAGRE